MNTRSIFTPSRLRGTAFIVVAIAVIIGSVTLVHSTIEKDNEKRVQEAFDRRILKVQDEIDREAIRYQNLVATIGTFFNASEKVSYTEFTQFINGLGTKSSFPGVKGIAYAQRMNGAEAAAFSKNASEAGVEFQVSPSSEEGEHAILTYVDPPSKDAMAGLDIYSLPDGRNSLNLSASEGVIISSPPMQYQVNDSLVTGFVLAYPISKGMPFTLPSNSYVQFSGWVFAFIDPVVMVNSIQSLEGLDISIVDEKSGQTLVAASGDQDSPYKAKFKYSIGQRERVAVVTPKQEFISSAFDGSRASQYSYLVLSVEIISILLVVVFFMHRIRRRREVNLTYQAAHDPLTGLPNRFFLEKWLKEKADSSTTSTRKVAVLFIDLDGFKAINDTLGHQMGDDFLVAISQRLHKEVRDRDILVRLGGDEFIIVLDEVSDETQATRIAQRIIDVVRFPVMLEAGPVCVGASIGIAVTTLEVAADAESVIRFADAAMYAAKEDKNQRIRVFDNKLKSIVDGRHEVESSIRGATARSEIIEVLQPLINISDYTTYGYEALCRWNHPIFGVLTPDQFLDAAKTTGEIIEIDRWMVNQAFQNSIQIAETSQRNTRVWVNLSVRHLLQGEFYQHVMRALRDSETSAEMLGVEVEEEVFKIDNGLLYPFLNQLRDLGIAIALDDFGSEDASLQALKRYIYDVIKLDRSLINEFAQHPQASIVPAVVELAHTKGMKVVATGVETPEQLQAVIDVGCDVVQGYVFSGVKSFGELVDLQPDFVWEKPLGVKGAVSRIHMTSDTGYTSAKEL